MLPAAERILLGPWPEPVSPRVMRAMAAPMLSHLAAEFLGAGAQGRLSQFRIRSVAARKLLGRPQVSPHHVRLTIRWARHERHHQLLATGLESMGLPLLPPPGERLWTLNAVRVPDGVDEATVRRRLLQRFNIEVGADLGPLAGKIWRVGLMGSSSTEALVTLFLAALDKSLRA